MVIKHQPLEHSSFSKTVLVSWTTKGKGALLLPFLSPTETPCNNALGLQRTKRAGDRMEPPYKADPPILAQLRLPSFLCGKLGDPVAADPATQGQHKGRLAALPLPPSPKQPTLVEVSLPSCCFFFSFLPLKLHVTMLLSSRNSYNLKDEKIGKQISYRQSNLGGL